MFSAFRSWDIVVIETIKADFKETRAKKTTPGHESAKRETARSSHKGTNNKVRRYFTIILQGVGAQAGKIALSAKVSSSTGSLHRLKLFVCVCVCWGWGEDYWCTM